ncbi:4Fe-4S dicluster domain-containing protein [Desulfohalovibrio reitneri]|uniref:4Fe-4S dicluster domain-containing protein n=1 Tax=Desulfohalovibrio reitneri TaxID=1307759 RepID=UPI0004A77A01|nr:4Fe-4S dicluster domain-containing protein [Desulfohalovibrio reitneri]
MNTAARTDPLALIRETMAACMQCGTCSASCVNAPDMDITPRRMWRLVQLGLWDELFASRTFWLCSACYACTLRCPRGLPLTDTIAALKRAAQAANAPRAKESSAFYRAFMDNVRGYGRVQESALMTRYLLARRSPALGLSYLPMGLKMLAKGKLHPPSTARRGRLDTLFAAQEEKES